MSDRQFLAHSQWQQLTNWCRNAAKVVVVGHMNPDHDALGSSLGLAEAISQLGASTWTTFGDAQAQVPQALSWLPRADHVTALSDLPAQPDLVIAVDCADLARLGPLGEYAQSAPHFAQIDHHASNTGFAELNLVAAAAPATGVLIAEWCEVAGISLDATIATCLYAAIASDTGGFQFRGTSAATFTTAAQLAAAGADVASVGRNLFGSRSWPLAQLAAQAVATADYRPDAIDGAGLLVSIISRTDRNRLQVSYDDVELVIGDLARISGPALTVLVKQTDDGSWKVSTRGNGQLNLGAICAVLGGGGHQQAAGYTSALSDPEQIVAELMQAVASSAGQ